MILSALGMFSASSGLFFQVDSVCSLVSVPRYWLFHVPTVVLHSLSLVIDPQTPLYTGLLWVDIFFPANVQSYRRLNCFPSDLQFEGSSFIVIHFS